MKLQEAIVLKVTPFQERDKIIQLYTPEEGKISAYVKGSKKEPLNWLQPITLIQGILWQKKGTLLGAKELVLLNAFAPLRESLDKIEAASVITKALSKSQQEGHPEPLLYSLYKKMLEGLGSNPQAVAASFLLKLLLMEGLFSQESPHQSFEESEWEEVVFLLNSRSLKEVSGRSISEALYKKIRELFNVH